MGALAKSRAARCAALTVGMASLTAIAACTPDRERPDVPVVQLLLDSATAVVGGTVHGRVIAVDRSGLIYLSIIGTNGDSTSRLGPLNFISIDSVDRTF